MQLPKKLDTASLHPLTKKKPQSNRKCSFGIGAYCALLEMSHKKKNQDLLNWSDTLLHQAPFHRN